MVSLAGTGGLLLIRRFRAKPTVPASASRRERHRELPSSALYLHSAEQALSSADVEHFYSTVFRVLELMHGELTIQNRKEREALLADCDAVRYGRYQPGHHEMEDVFTRVKSLHSLIQLDATGV